MTAGAGALAGASAVLGLAGPAIAGLLDAPLPSVTAVSVGGSLAAAAIGAGAVLSGWRAPGPVIVAARRGLYADAALRAIAQVPALGAARLLARFDDALLDGGVVDATGRGTLRLARAQRVVEERGIDAAVDGLARATGRAGLENRRLQTGRLYEYLRDTVLGAAAIVLLIALAALL